jgi:tetratricopeptide (TPR) repeat protein
MSLVNDMLRDLEQRNGNTANVRGNLSAVKAAQNIEEPPQSFAPRYVLWVIGLVALAMTLWLLWQQYVTEYSSLEKKPKSKVNTELADRGLEEERFKRIESVASIPKVPVSPIAPSKETLIETVIASEVKWTETDLGGDLVVRLSNDADVQVLNQKDKSIVIALDDVVLKTALPLISSSFIRRFDMNVDEQQRTLLTLTTHVPSQFVFRLDISPTTLILGVIPQQAEREGDKLADKAEDSLPLRTDENVVVEVVKSVPVESIRSGSDLHVNVSADTAGITPKAIKPVAKTSLTLSDRQVAMRSRQLIGKGAITGAEKQMLTFITGQPNRAKNVRGVLATLLLSKGDMQGSQNLVTKSLQMHPNDGTLKKLQARIWMSNGKIDRTVALLNENPPTITNDSEYYELMATALQQQGNPEKAAQVYYQLLQFENDVPRWWIGMGYALEQVKRYSDARSAYQRGMQIPAIDSGLKNYARQRVQALAGR